MIPSATRPRKMLSSSPSVSGRVMTVIEYPASSTPRAAAMISRCAGGLKSCGTCMAMSPVRPDRIWRHALWGAKPISSMTRSTRSRVSSATSALLLRIRETVAIETPLAAAMSMIVVLGTFERVVTRALLGQAAAAGSSSDRLPLHRAGAHPRQDPALRDDVDQDHGQDGQD